MVDSTVTTKFWINENAIKRLCRELGQFTMVAKVNSLWIIFPLPNTKNADMDYQCNRLAA
jgi:hypothetical protein